MGEMDLAPGTPLVPRPAPLPQISPIRAPTVVKPAPPAPTPPPTDPAEDRADDWFGTSFTPDTTPQRFCQATAFPSARAYWDQLWADLEKVRNPQTDFVYIAGWDFSVDTPLHRGPDVRLRDELDRIGGTQKIPVRALFPFIATSPKQNLSAVGYFSGLANGDAMWDTRTAIAGTHHQKMVVLHHEDGLIGYCGGIDLEPGRENWIDSQVRVRGGAAHDLHTVFVQRWNDQGPVKHKPLGPTPTLPPTPFTGDDRVTVRIARTYPKLRGGTSLLPRLLGGGSINDRLLSQQPPYRFAPRGETTVYDMLSRAIRATKRFIYAQDQYLVESAPMRIGPTVAELLAAKLREATFQRLIIVITRSEVINGELLQAWRRRKDFVAALSAAEAAKVTVCQHRIAAGATADYIDPPYLHAKTWIFDDRFAIVGSANCDRRGYTYDSEVAAGIYDPVAGANRLALAHDLRISQMLQILTIKSKASPNPPPVTRADLVDFTRAAGYFTTPNPAAPIEPYEPDHTRSPAANKNPDGPLSIGGKNVSDQYAWDNLLDPDGS